MTDSQGDGFRSNEREKPAYQALYMDLRSSLVAGRFADGERMSTETELAEQYSVSRQTVRRAFQDLVSEGLVYRVPGRGTFPSKFLKDGYYSASIGAIEDLQAFAGTEMELLQRTELVAEEEIAQRLGLQSKVVAALMLRRMYEGVPFGLTRVYLPPDLGLRLAESEALPTTGLGTVIGTLESFRPGFIAGANQIITAMPTPSDVAPHIDYETGQPCLCTERTYFDTEGTPIELAISFYNPDRYAYRIQMHRRGT